MEQQIHFCTTEDGVRIAYATVGEGPPLVKAANWLSHLEFDWRSPVWRHLLAEFARDHTLIRYDERGNGLSDWNVTDLSFEAWVKDLESVVEAAGVDRFPLLGISQGGAVAIAYAVRHPEKVSQLILYGAYARGWAAREQPEEIEQRQAQLTLVKLGWGKDNPAFRQLWTSLYAPDATPEQAQSFNDLQRVSTSPQNAVALLNVMGNIDVVDLLPQVKVPTLVLHSRDESGVPFEEGRLLASSIPGARFVPLDGRNHLLLEGAPAWGTFVKELRRFLGTEHTSIGLTQLTGPGISGSPPTRTDLPERYTIISFLGVGGMGEVYLAEDTRLGRKVAIKTLPTEFTNDKERLRRFQQEARTASGLNHPNLLTIHEIGAESGAHFIAAEYIDGETLRARIKRGRVPIDEALDLAQQAAFALTAAHGAGIVHRDIKPENIMVRHDGIVKVLDFGLAKLLEDHAREMIDHEADTRALVLTDPGKVLGTPAYMSPEQARGLDLDARTDIWSLGVVLYEMVAGRAPFRGETKSHTVVSILETEPPSLATFAPDAPAELQRIVRKALTKDRDSRYQTARDLMLDLKSLRRDLDIQSEIDRSNASSARVSDDIVKPVVAATDADAGLSERVTSLAHARPTSGDDQAGEGSIRFRVMALVAMVLLAIGAMSVWYFLPRQNPESPIESIVVLPFVNTSNDVNAEYLSDGIAESLMNNLSQLPNLKVMSRSTAFQYKGKDQSAPKVGKELGVRAVVTGTVKQIGDQIVISVSLDDALDSHQIWGEQYNRKLADILAVQNEIAREISGNLRLKLSGEERPQLARRSPENSEAYQLYLKGRFEANKFAPEAFPKAIEYYNQAIAIDQGYALAYAGLAEIYSAEANFGVPPKEAYPKAKLAADKALTLDEGLPEAHRAVGQIKLFYDWDFPAAEREFKRAFELNPNYAEAYSAYSAYLKSMRRHDEEIVQAKRGQSLDPLSAFTNMELGEAYYMARRYDESIDQITRTLQIDPHLVGFAYHVRARAYEQKKMYAEAVADCQQWLKPFPDDEIALGTLGHIYGSTGNRREAESILARLQAMAKQRYFSSYWIAMVYAGLGDKDKTFEYLDKALAERYFLLIWINADPRLDNLRSDPRFARLVGLIGLPQ